MPQHNALRIPAFGMVGSLAFWERVLNIPRSTLRERLLRGIPPQQALTTGRGHILKTHCKLGHPLQRNPQGVAKCPVCAREATRRWRERQAHDHQR